MKAPPKKDGRSTTAATVADLARIVGVSETTVSLAFQPDSRISKSTRQRVLDVACQLHYVPNRHARMLRAGRTRLIGLLVNDLTNPFYAQLADVIEEEVEKRGYHLSIFNSRWSARREIDAIEKMAELRMEGVLVCYSEQTGKSRDLLTAHAIPHIAVDTHPEKPSGNYVLFDMNAAGQLAAAHFAELGCRHPVLLMPDQRSIQGLSAFNQLEKGFREQWKLRRPGRGSVRRVAADLTIPAGKEAYFQLCRTDEPVDAILCGNDLCALGVVDTADVMGTKVGESLAVMGIDNLSVGAMSRLGLTSIAQPLTKLAALAATTLLDGIEQKKEPSIQRFLEPELVQRSSTLRFQKPIPK